MSPSFFVFLVLYLLSFIFVINMDDWFLIWFGLELNMFGFLLMIFERNNGINIESCFKYFFIQSLGSAVFISMMYLNESSCMLIGSIMLVYKMGGGPFFYWFPSVCGGISWMSNFFLMSLQKFLPLILLSEVMSWFLWFILFMSLIVGVIGAFNQNNAKQLMAFSSIHQIGWLLMCMYVDKFVWIFYYFVYVMVLYILVLKFNNYKIVNLLSVNEMKYKWWLIFSVLNIGGMPPLLGFFLKWFGLYNFSKINIFFLFFMIIMSVVMFYVYLRICYNIFMNMGMVVSWVEGKDYKNFSKMEVDVMDIFIILGSIMGGILVFMFM